MRVLIAEDDLTSRKMLYRILLDYGECTAVVNGREAVEEFQRSLDENTPYDLICMDILMPELDGLQALSAIRDIEHQINADRSSRVNVIMTTTLTDPQTLAMALIKLDVNSYIVKPVSKQRLLYEVKKLGLIEQSDSAEVN